MPLVKLVPGTHELYGPDEAKELNLKLKPSSNNKREAQVAATVAAITAAASEAVEEPMEEDGPPGSSRISRGKVQAKEDAKKAKIAKVRETALLSNYLKGAVHGLCARWPVWKPVDDLGE